MAVRKTNANTSRSDGLFKKGITALLIAGFLGFLTLLCWSLYIWATGGFEDALNRLEQLSHKQSSLISKYGDHAFIAKPAAWLKPPFDKSFQSLTRDVKARAGGMNERFKDNIETFEAELLQEKDKAWFISLFGNAIDFIARFYLLSQACFHVLAIKFMICCAAIPLFALTGLAGLIDGLNQRAIRTASLGRESTYVFHKSLPLARKVLFWVLVVWLALPLTLNPTPLFVSLSVLLAMVMSVSASRFKKYL